MVYIPNKADPALNIQMKVPIQLTPLKPLVLLMYVLLKTCVRAGMMGVSVSVYVQSLKRLHLLCHFWSIDSLLIAPCLTCGVSTVADRHCYRS